jgi:hypothetical protein
MKTTEEARRGGGPRRWRCSEERCAAPMCSASRGRIGGEEGRGQSRVEGLGVALTGGGRSAAWLGSCGTEGEERRGWWGSDAGGTTRRKEGRLGLGHATRRTVCREGWRGLAPARAGGGRPGVAVRARVGDEGGELAGFGAGRGAWPAGAGGGRPDVAARARAGDEGGGVLVGVVVARPLPWADPSAQCRF